MAWCHSLATTVQAGSMVQSLGCMEQHPVVSGVPSRCVLVML
jgi:hypothetical protein